ncbi:cytochrome P450 [Suillus subalutaceus]|uniref:cytochrome P450 n=1 Tax=Suillus subalutaceus TaxID=48586 RepID=UPI001B85BE28|nr:cytochrome P450 [Suillus subalutaceus]KAG1831216.1 cytochrome P450 [Suillus subalutaceus]
MRQIPWSSAVGQAPPVLPAAGKTPQFCQQQSMLVAKAVSADLDGHASIVCTTTRSYEIRNRRMPDYFVSGYRPFLTIAGWIDEYGPLITIRLKFERIVIIGRYKAAAEIMENQGKFLADRPPMIAAGELFSGGMSIGFIPFGDRFRRMRRALHSHLQPKAAEAYQPLQMSHAKNIVLGVLDNPHNFRHHVITYAATIILKVTYGKNTPTSATDPDVIEALQMMRRFIEILRPGVYLVDSIPWLKYLPWYGRDLKLEFESRKKIQPWSVKPCEGANVVPQQSDMDIGPSFMKDMLEDSQSHGLTETEVAFLGGAFLGAGLDTTSISICTVLMAAARFPEEQAKVQAELDAVIGRHRGVPTFTLQERLTEQPKMKTIVFQLGLRIMLQEIKDLIVTALGLSLGIQMSTQNHTRSSLNAGLTNKGDLRDDLKFFVYGFGRRVCPGQHVANRSVFIITLLILWAYKLTLDPTKPLDDMELMAGSMPNVLPYTLEFGKRISETELRSMMQHYPEVA